MKIQIGDIIVREISQVNKEEYCILPLVFGNEKQLKQKKNKKQKKECDSDYIS